MKNGEIWKLIKSKNDYDYYNYAKIINFGFDEDHDFNIVTIEPYNEKENIKNSTKIEINFFLSIYEKDWSNKNII